MKIFQRLLSGAAAIALALAMLPGVASAKDEAAAEKMPSFTVICDLDGNHESDPDRLSHQREIELMTAAIARAYPLLPPELKEIAGKIAFVINHSNKEATKLYSGWSAEDDTGFYKYPDTKFHNPEKTGPDYGADGTIRVNFTEKFILGLDLGDTVAQKDSNAGRGAIISYGAVVVKHELKHAHQWHTGPVRANVNDHPEMFADGLMDRELLSDMIKKIRYERDALAAHRELIESGPLMDFAKAAQQYEKDRPEQFEVGAKYYLLGGKLPNSFTGRYLQMSAETVGDGDKFDEKGEVIYYGQVVPPGVVLDLKSLNDEIEASGKIDGAAANLSALKTEWSKYVDADPTLWKANQEAMPYLIEVEKRYNSELARFEKLTGPH